MGLFLIAETSFLEWGWVIFQVAFGLGLVIFVHELGHFLVAKACGVQCDKFYIGFDAGGYKICSFQWGETEYGIGIIPLGGYVKMLGQDDNPANAARELERARIAKEQPTDAAAEDDAPYESPEPQYTLNPRSYLAKSVPQRMAIISAGVIMNIIFAFIFATIAYGLGVKYQPTVVSEVVPGSPAWEANLQPGDEIVQIGDVSKPRFLDLKYGVSLGDLESGVNLVVTRPGVEQPFDLTIKPEHTGPLPTIGVKLPKSLTLYEEMPAYPNTPAAAAQPALVGGDTIVAANGQPIDDYAQLAAIMAREPSQPLRLTVRRQSVDEGDEPSTRSEEKLKVEVPANPLRRLGLVMRIGAVTGVQKDSPAARAGLKPADFITQINGEPVGDPVTLPARLRRMAQAGEGVVLTVERASSQGPSETLEIPVTLRIPASIETSMPGTPMSAPALGIAYRILNRVHSVEPGGPADKAGIVSGDEVVAARFVPGEGDLAEITEEEAAHLLTNELTFSDDNPNWPALVEQLQWLPADMQVELTVGAGDNERQVMLQPVDSAEWFSPDRGFVLRPLERIRKADSLGEAIEFGSRETKESLLMVYRFLQKLGSQIPVTALGGPITIAKAAGYSAFEGPAKLLLFLTILSANLAVVNFLPIPVLDGGHMVFLIIEGVMRRPVSEKVVVAFQTLGFVFILSLMLFVIALDLGVIPRGL